MDDVRKKIISELKKAVKELASVDVVPSLEHPKDERHGDYATNIAMAIFSSSKFKVQSSKLRSPIDLARGIVEKLKVKSSILRQSSGQASKVLEKIEAVAPGFINFRLSKDYLTTLMIRIIKVKDGYGTSKRLRNKKIMLEFADPNPFKEFHIGHLYSNIVGESLSRLLESQGAIVWRVCYQGDVGLHVAKALYGLL